MLRGETKQMLGILVPSIDVTVIESWKIWSFLVLLLPSHFIDQLRLFTCQLGRCHCCPTDFFFLIFFLVNLCWRYCRD